ncbi:oxidoreductase [Nocardia nova]|uniref:Oxidoreductase n=1 Tax=Nocardia nova TaxID=37330 RepID=A0A2S6AN96_9NOCA|nr:SDR family oxidoreductase [Nocardia nova]PPJ25707.1 oxidoreductase [Nocardia nova]PPJ36666.1 oxidoreductase [Nocardia nova]
MSSDSSVYGAEFIGKVAVVTGAARGMGAAHARGLAAMGTDVMAADLDENQVCTMAEDHNARRGAGAGRIFAMKADVRLRSDHDRILEKAVDEFGRLDFWINNAGVFLEAPVADMDSGLLHTTFAVNVDGVIFGAQAAARHMKDNGGGVIVNVGSVSGSRVRMNRVAYCSSKAAVAHATRCMAVELGPWNIRVNSVAPGFIDTVLTNWVKSDPQLFEETMGSIPLRRMGTPEEVFKVIAFLLSSQASYVTGSEIAVDGGSIHV